MPLSLSFFRRVSRRFLPIQTIQVGNTLLTWVDKYVSMLQLPHSAAAADGQERRFPFEIGRCLRKLPNIFSELSSNCITNEHRLQYISYSPIKLCRPCCSSSPVCKGAGPSLDKIHRIDLRPCQLFYSIVAPYHVWSSIHVNPDTSDFRILISSLRDWRTRFELLGLPELGSPWRMKI